MKRYQTIRSHKFGFSYLIDNRAMTFMAFYMAVLGIVFICNIGFGSLFIAPLDVIKSLIGMGEPSYTMIIQQFRLPRIITALLVGAVLAGAGAILQSLVRNPLASPDLIGITQGAAVTGVIFIMFFEHVSIFYLPIVAMFGAAVTTFMLYALSWKKGVTPFRLVLIGVGLDAALQGLVKMFLVISPLYTTEKAQIWLTGSVYGSSWHEVIILTIGVMILFPIALSLTMKINTYQLGDDVAASIGNSVQRNRFFLLAISAAMIGLAVSVAGPIGFVGLLAPHIARKIVGSSFGMLFPFTLCIGGTIVMLADLIARTILPSDDLPVGIFTSLIGAPFFIFLLLRSRKNR